MSTPLERAREEFTGILVFLILGAGFVALFLNQPWFWMVWVLGFAVLLPIVGILTGETEEDEEASPIGARRSGTESTTSASTSTARTDEGVEDALETLRARYARGDLSDEQFERKLEALLETETPEEARERVRRGDPDERVGSGPATDRDRDQDRDREFELDRNEE
jgi:hypothetical protein